MIDKKNNNIKKISFRIDKEFARTRREKKTLNTNVEINDIQNLPKPKPKCPKLVDYHFFQDKENLIELLTKESDFKFNKKNKLVEFKDEDGNGLSIEENLEKERILKTGFTNWNKQDFNLFLQANERFGRNSFKEISEVIIK